MTAPATATEPSASPEFFWDDLLEYIDERRVIPIVGPELLVVPDGKGGEVSLPQLIAARLAERLRVPFDAAAAGTGALSEVVVRYLQRGGRREEVYPRVRNLLRELAPVVPAPLRALARIRHFNVYVTTTFDSLLAQALDEERFGGAARTQSLAFAPNRTQDLPADARHGATPTVYHLFGRASASPDYVVTEEDMLEFFTAVQSEARRPPVLLDELKSNHLLLLGSTLPDWLARFFIRIAKSGRLSLQREELEVVADRSVQGEPSLVLFLRNFSYRTQIFEQGNAIDFVNELSVRYAEWHPPAESGPSARVNGGPAPVPAAPAEGEAMRSGAVFLSYASEDVAAVQALRDALEAAGVEVWFDKRRLEGGDDFDQQINRNIRGRFLFCAGDLGADAGAARGLFPAGMDARRGAVAADRGVGAVHPARRDRSGERDRGAGAGAVPASAVEPAAGRAADAGIRRKDGSRELACDRAAARGIELAPVSRNVS